MNLRHPGRIAPDSRVKREQIGELFEPSSRMLLPQYPEDLAGRSLTRGRAVQVFRLGSNGLAGADRSCRGTSLVEYAQILRMPGAFARRSGPGRQQ